MKKVTLLVALLLPLSACVKPAAIRRTVDLPQPEAPSRQVMPDSTRFRDIPRRIHFSPKCLTIFVSAGISCSPQGSDVPAV